MVADDSDLPRAVSWLELTDPRLGDDPMAVIERWQESTSILTGPAAQRQGAGRPGTLRAVVGAAAGAMLVWALREFRQRIVSRPAVPAGGSSSLPARGEDKT